MRISPGLSLIELGDIGQDKVATGSCVPVDVHERQNVVVENFGDDTLERSRRLFFLYLNYTLVSIMNAISKYKLIMVHFRGG